MAKEFTIKKIEKLDTDAIKRLSAICDLSNITTMVKDGYAAAFEVIEEGSRVGIFALCQELMIDNRHDMVIMIGEGNSSFDACKKIIPAIEEFAIKMGCTRCRFETSRAGLIAKIAAFREITCTWDIVEQTHG